MKKLTLFLFAMLLACATNLWAEDVTINFGSSTGNCNFKTSPTNFTDAQDNTWQMVATFSSESSFTENAAYSHVGSGKKPATSITMTGTATKAMNITAIYLCEDGWF